MTSTMDGGYKKIRIPTIYINHKNTMNIKHALSFVIHYKNTKKSTPPFFL